MERNKAALCEICDDAARASLVQELREVLRSRGFWFGRVDSDLIGAFAMALDALEKRVDNGSD